MKCPHCQQEHLPGYCWAEVLKEWSEAYKTKMDIFYRNLVPDKGNPVRLP